MRTRWEQLLAAPKPQMLLAEWRRLHNPRKLFALSMLILILLAMLLYQSSSIEHLNGVYHGREPPIAHGMPIRLMFMGASITRGEVSAGHRGYRKQIRDWLVSIGNPVNCVGGNRFGDFKDNDVEGWGAAMVKMLLDEHVRHDLPLLQPNLILLQVGTSDCFRKDDDPAYVLQRMRSLMDFIFEKVNTTTVVMSTVVTTPREDVERCILTVNAQIRQVANDLIREKRRVVLAEMHYDQRLPGRPNRPDIGIDQIHPTNEGYAMMGEIFKEKVREVNKLGYIQPPSDNGIIDNGDEEKDEEAARYKVEDEKKRIQEMAKEVLGEGESPKSKEASQVVAPVDGDQRGRPAPSPRRQNPGMRSLGKGL